jgi:hypothetical protein
MRSGYHDTDQSQSTKQKSHIHQAGTIRVRFLEKQTKLFVESLN